MQLTSSKIAFYHLRFLGRLEVEEFWVLALHANKRLIGRECVFRGTVDACPVFPRDVFRMACRQNAAGIIVAHNHPSGDTRPSDKDIAITEQLRLGSELLAIELIDHLIVGGGAYWSFADAGYLMGASFRSGGTLG